MSNSMFRDLDIRGKYGSEITPTKFEGLGAACRTEFKELVAGMDYRPHNPELLQAFARGFDKPVENLGFAPSPAIAFLSQYSGMSLTASHNPAEYNGAKFFQQQTYVSERLMQRIEKRFREAAPQEQGNAPSGTISNAPERLEKYLDSLPEFENGIYDLAGGAVCSIKDAFPQRIFDSPDPTFSKHAAEPKDSTLGVLKTKTQALKKVGFAFDGDGDRVMAVDDGMVSEGDVTAAFIATQLLTKKDRIVLSIDCRQEVFELLEEEGFKVITSKVGDANVLRLAQDQKATFSAERSGHFSFLRHAPNSDGIYAAARLSGTRFGELKKFNSNFKNVTLKDEIFCRADFGKIAAAAQDAGAEKIETMDGVKAVIEPFTLLVRASTTEPKIRINAESKTPAQAKKGLEMARDWVKRARL